MSARRSGVAVLIAGLVVASAGVSATGIRHRDSVGDVKEGPGPDITAVTAFEQADRIKFRVDFAKAPPLTFSNKSGFTDMLSISISTTGKLRPAQSNYALAVHGADLKRVGLVSAEPPPKKGQQYKVVWVEPAVVSGKSVTLSLDPHLIGNPKTIRYAALVGREMSTGTGGGIDRAPDLGTWLWVR